VGLKEQERHQALPYLIFVITSFEVSLLYNQDTVGGPICLFEFPFSSLRYYYVVYILHFFGRYVVCIQFNVSSTCAFFGINAISP
jgi:hypothetical protein